MIVSDSTAATYEVSRLPRMGWGQVFEQQFAPDSGVVVLNGARAGRFQPDFYNEGWYQQMARFMRAGDYVLIAHGITTRTVTATNHCAAQPMSKTCVPTPNNNKGERQFPEGHPEMSYQTSLERYINTGAGSGRTPCTAYPNRQSQKRPGENGFCKRDTQPVVSSHHTPAKPGYLFSGDYIASVRKTAADNAVPLLDLEAATLALANQHPQDWQTYWLAVDPARYPWYQTQPAARWQTLTRPTFSKKAQKPLLPWSPG